MTTRDLEYSGYSSFQGYIACFGLFTACKQNIILNTNNIFKEGKLTEDSIVKYSLTTANDGKKWFALKKNELDAKEMIRKLAG